MTGDRTVRRQNARTGADPRPAQRTVRQVTDSAARRCGRRGRRPGDASHEDACLSAERVANLRAMRTIRMRDVLVVCRQVAGPDNIGITRLRRPMHTSTRAVLLLSLSLCAAILAQPDRATSATAASHPTKLSVTSTQIGPGTLRVKQTYRVRCAPMTGATVPRPVATCRALARYPGMLRWAAPVRGLCPVPRYWIDVTGRRDGRAINVSFRSCAGTQRTMIKAWLSLLQ
jgi:hypothetical protein